jgi:hypothetical protein
VRRGEFLVRAHASCPTPMAGNRLRPEVSGQSYRHLMAMETALLGRPK